jgi:hypothetical protein
MWITSELNNTLGSASSREAVAIQLHDLGAAEHRTRVILVVTLRSTDLNGTQTP